MQPASTLDRRAEREATLRLLQELSPGARLVRTRRFRGGLGSLMHLLTIEDVSGARSNLVLRRYINGWGRSTPAAAANEFRILELLETTGTPAPRPLFLDADGRYFGAPTMVLSYLPGRSFLAPNSRPDSASHQLAVWTDDLSRALVQIHALTPADYDLSWLPSVPSNTSARDEIEERRPQVADMEPLAHEVLEALESMVRSVTWMAPCLIHDDYWPGNTVWSQGRLTGVIDWTQAKVGDARADISQCRADLIVSHDLDLADAFLEAYGRNLGTPLPDMTFFDLLRGLRALVYYEHWLKGYHDAGMTHLTAEAVGERLRDFLRRILTSA